MLVSLCPPSDPKNEVVGSPRYTLGHGGSESEGRRPDTKVQSWGGLGPHPLAALERLTDVLMPPSRCQLAAV